MAEGRSVIRNTPISAGDAAVDGLFGGLLAGLSMAIFLILVGLTIGAGPGVTMSHFDATEGTSPWIGSMLHMAVAGVYGLTFALLYRMVVKRVPGWLAGLIYGAILFAMARGVLPASGSPLVTIPFWQFGIAHLLYGLVLGAMVGKRGA